MIEIFNRFFNPGRGDEEQETQKIETGRLPAGRYYATEIKESSLGGIRDGYTMTCAGTDDNGQSHFRKNQFFSEFVIEPDYNANPNHNPVLTISEDLLVTPVLKVAHGMLRFNGRKYLVLSRKLVTKYLAQGIEDQFERQK